METKTKSTTKAANLEVYQGHTFQYQNNVSTFWIIVKFQGKRVGKVRWYDQAVKLVDARIAAKGAR